MTIGTRPSPNCPALLIVLILLVVLILLSCSPIVLLSLPLRLLRDEVRPQDDAD